MNNALRLALPIMVLALTACEPAPAIQREEVSTEHETQGAAPVSRVKTADTDAEQFRSFYDRYTESDVVEVIEGPFVVTRAYSGSGYVHVALGGECPSFEDVSNGTGDYTENGFDFGEPLVPTQVPAGAALCVVRWGQGFSLVQGYVPYE
ncbi:MAG: hypothetical protein HOW73_51180 [Polyangiaceae bacterium]|nr:hypothetical protein [Polyangiaceae bacterium]